MNRIAGLPSIMHRMWGSTYHRYFSMVVFIILTALDNAVIGIIPSLYRSIASGLSSTEAAIGGVTALAFLIRALTGPFWGFVGDRRSRKWLLIICTSIWSIGMAVSGQTERYSQFLAFQLVTAFGLGCITPVGYSLMSDSVSTKLRGTWMSLYVIAQGSGLALGAVLGGTVGAQNWREPFMLIARAGLAFAFLYVFAYEPRRGEKEAETNPVPTRDTSQKHTVRLATIANNMLVPSNLWVLLASTTVSVYYGALTWIPRLLIAKLELLGFNDDQSLFWGNVLGILSNIGFNFSLLLGYAGDTWYRYNPRGRAMLGMIGLLAAIPFYLTFFLMPLTDIKIPDSDAIIPVVSDIITNGFESNSIFFALMVSFLATFFLSAEIPSRFASISDINLPEHRGTVFGIINVFTGTAVALGNGLAGVIFEELAKYVKSPEYFMWGLASFLPCLALSAIFYGASMRKLPSRLREISEVLSERTLQMKNPQSQFPSESENNP